MGPRNFSAASATISAWAALCLSGCAGLSSGPYLGEAPQRCELLSAPIAATEIGLPSGPVQITSATLTGPSPLVVSERAPTPAGRMQPALPRYCKVLGRIAPLDAKAPPIEFEVNLPLNWNGRSLQYGGGGFNGTLITGLGLPPAARFDQPAPLAQGYVTVGTDSGHQNQPGVAPQAFALNDEALNNFAHAAYKKVRDVSVVLMRRAYGHGPEHMYFMGSSEGGREALTMAQRYPNDFDGILSRVPVINWTGLQHAGTRNGLATFSAGWLRPAQVKLVQEAVLKKCDAADGVLDGLVADTVACRANFDVTTLQCPAGSDGSSDLCLSPAQVHAVQTLHSPWQAPFALANGVGEYPGWGIGGEATASFASTGGWSAWWLGRSPPEMPPRPDNGIAWQFGSGAIQYFYARQPGFDPRQYRPQDFAERVRAVSALMDSTDPDLSAFAAHGGKLLLLEHMADYAQSPYAGIAYFESVQRKLGADKVAGFMRLYTAPGVDHVGSGAPANADLLSVLRDWVEQGSAPSRLQVLEQSPEAPFATRRALPLCEWPLWPRYRGGDVALATSFECSR